MLALVLFIVVAGLINSSGTKKSTESNITSSGLAVTTESSAPPVDSSFGWLVSESASQMDNSPKVVLSVDGDRDVQGWLDEHRPSLIVRCQERRVEVFIVTGMAADVEYGMHEEHTVRVRLDSAPARTEVWSESSDDKALFSPSGRKAFNRLTQANQMLFQFTPFKANPATVAFDLRGLKQHKDKITKACPAR